MSSVLDIAPPLSVIEPKQGWLKLDFRELLHYRELLYFLTWRDIKIRYKQTVLGAAWAVLQPFLSMVVFTIFFGRLAKMPSDGIPYPIFVYAGLLPWTFFANAVSNSGTSLVGSAQLISKVYFPRIFVPTSKVMAALVDFFLSAVILLGLMFYYRIPLTWNLAFVPVAVLLTILAAFGVGAFLSSLNVKYRDFQYVIPFLVQFWMFCSPVVYPASIVPERWRWVLSLNPMAGIINAYRASFLGRAFDWNGLAISTAVTLALFLLGVSYFTKVERKFADII
jgi:lipopolysaccharide transport system permease protein